MNPNLIAFGILAIFAFAGRKLYGILKSKTVRTAIKKLKDAAKKVA